MENAGIPLPDVDPQYLNILRKIGHGQVLPELWLKYCMFTGISRMLCYSKTDQRRLVENESFKVVVIGEKDRFTNRKMKVDTLTKQQFNQLFGKTGINDERKQIAYLEGEKNRAALKPTTKLDDPVMPKLIKGNKILEITGPCRLTKRQVADLYFLMK